jgi:hypothetical protein
LVPLLVLIGEDSSSISRKEKFYEEFCRLIHTTSTDAKELNYDQWTARYRIFIRLMVEEYPKMVLRRAKTRKSKYTAEFSWGYGWRTAGDCSERPIKLLTQHSAGRT